MENGKQSDQDTKDAKTDNDALLQTAVVIPETLQASAGRGRLRFQRAVRSIILMIRSCRYIITRSNYCQLMELHFKEPTPPPVIVGNMLLYDVNHFKVRESQIPGLLEEIMQKTPEQRSKKEVSLIQNMLRTLSMFRRYSRSFQLHFSRVVRYQRLERRRVVFQKGHCGNSLYFVFSGLLAVTKDDDGSSAFVDKNPILLKEGMTFGDVALIKRQRRNTTVVCMERTELMVVDKEDFFAYKMHREIMKEFEDHLSFFRSLQLFSTWSSSLIEQMTDQSQAEVYCFDHVVVKDTNEMSNILFIFKGQCDLLRKVDLTSCSGYQRLLKQHAYSGSTATRSPPTGVNDRLTNHEEGGAKMDLPTHAWFVVDTLSRGSTYGLHQYNIPPSLRDPRRFTLVSQGVEIVRVEMPFFEELVDNTTINKLKDLAKSYPSDEELCKVFLKQNHWEAYKRHVVQGCLMKNPLAGP
ncbi:hypothetical protein UPYG_G00022770 [Umbra pygmaea]|uniref:Cyclic nucleotide-binding domain-containing protein 2 n=1 Tax=Umbra pygmaea TaxID=75934 RepID=A0ABD0YA89_UMBPY